MHLEIGFHTVANLAPRDPRITAYDQAHFLTYARVLDAERDGLGWEIGVQLILYRDFDDNVDAGKLCWNSHVDRAEWIVGDGLALIAQHHPASDSVTHEPFCPLR